MVQTALQAGATRERPNVCFEVAVSDYPVDALSTQIIEQFGPYDFSKLKQLHETRKTRLTRFSLATISGFVLAAAFLVLDRVPKKLVQLTPLPYGWFEVIVFGLTILFLGYLVVVMLPFWFKYRDATRTHTYVGSVLEYTALKQSPS
jgi:hypothetical protein